MEILAKKSRSNFSIAIKVKNIENNICASRLYYSAFQGSIVLLNTYSTTQGVKVNPATLSKINTLIKSIKTNSHCSHEDVISALGLLVLKKVGYHSFISYRNDIKLLKNYRVIADYRSVHITEEQIKDAFNLYNSVQTILKNKKLST